MAPGGLVHVPEIIGRQEDLGAATSGRTVARVGGRPPPGTVSAPRHHPEPGMTRTMQMWHGLRRRVWKSPVDAPAQRSMDEERWTRDSHSSPGSLEQRYSRLRAERPNFISAVDMERLSPRERTRAVDASIVYRWNEVDPEFKASVLGRARKLAADLRSRA